MIEYRQKLNEDDDLSERLDRRRREREERLKNMYVHLAA